MDDALRRGKPVAEIDPSAHAGACVGGKVDADFPIKGHAQIVDDAGVSPVRRGSERVGWCLFGVENAQRLFAAEQLKHVLKA